MELINFFEQANSLKKWRTGLTEGEKQLIIGLASEASRALVMATAFKQLQETMLVVVSNQNEAETLAANLTAILGDEQVLQFFSEDIPASEFMVSSFEKRQSRLDVLVTLLTQDKPVIVVTSIAGTKLFLPNPNDFRTYLLDVNIEQEIEPNQLLAQCIAMGYQKVSKVTSPGEVSRRGDIIDLFSLTDDLPVRIEFFGDEIDGIRYFDPEEQRSIEQLERYQIVPADDMILTSKDFQRAQEQLEDKLKTEIDEDYRRYLLELQDAIQNQIHHKDFRAFLTYFYSSSYTLLDYLPEQTYYLVDDYQKIMDTNQKFEIESTNLHFRTIQGEDIILNHACFVDSLKIIRQHARATYFSNYHKGLGNLRFSAIHQLSQYKMQEFFNDIPMLVDEISRYHKNKATVIIQVSDEQKRHQLEQLITEYDKNLAIPMVNEDDLSIGQIQLTSGNLTSGFYFADEKLAFITESEIYHRRIRRKIRRRNVSNAERLKDYNELQTGDYVVHENHGIGRFIGIQTLEVSGIHRDYVTLQYDGSARVSVPVEQIDILSKYVASDGREPRLNKLNDGRFKRTKQKVTKQVEDIADDLIKLYAERSQLKGFAFSPDDENQEEFDNDFAYAETDDQLRSIDEIKKDMEEPKPMDRLLVGDVGFGKTEVAMRAAFKAVNDHKQVAILVPTTVLAQQHYENFKERFENFPVEVDVLSRFRSKKEQNETVERLAKGQIDIIIGTHRLLSKDITFSDLGLIVIDEEQRFGVKHKERLKTLKNKVDVLTLTATPIPRTLHMSMMGIRDLSVIETAPTNRYPVQTYVMENNYGIVREAILRELDRDGQAYYIFNSVEQIEQKVSELQDLIPEAAIGFVHGQMSEIQLENTLMAFINREFDVLVATTIIETGVDIPNVNTLFIENADKMGLSTLYQLRGRVGRSNRIAYAYLMYQPNKILSEVSQQRLEAIRGFTELGSGFKIAMRDLSIRGAGNLLGSAQSGYIDSVGFDMYTQLLEQAVARKQGKEVTRQKGNAEINLKIDAYLPDFYIDDERQKIDIYKRIRDFSNLEDYRSLQDELIDRFGDYPDQVAYLIEIGLLKMYSDQIFINTIERKDYRIIVRFESKAQEFFTGPEFFEALGVTKMKAKVGDYKGAVEIDFDCRRLSDVDILEELTNYTKKALEIKERHLKKD